jgi:hypothetical protein
VSQATDINKRIQELRDELKQRWREFGIERYQFKCERDKALEEIQAEIKKMFPGDFREMKGL